MRSRIIVGAAALLAALGTCCAGASAPAPSAARALAEPPRLRTPRLGARARTLSAAFDEERAMETVRFVDRFFRVRGNVGYLRSLAHVREGLLAAGYDEAQVRVLELGPERPTWTPVSARLELLDGAGTATLLHGFRDETERDRATLLVGSAFTPATELEVVLAGSGQDERGRVVLGRGGPRALYREHVEEGGAAGILTLFLMEGVHDPERHPDAAQFGYLPRGEGQRAFGFSVSPRADARLREAIERGGGRARVRVQIDVKVGVGRATAVELTIPGTRDDAPPVVLVAHVDEPGAHDNASGVAALLELARALRSASAAGNLPTREGPLVMLWGQEIECSAEWARTAEVPAAAALVLDMVGGAPESVGAPFLIERMPDPGAVWLRAPDEPSGWGSTRADPDRLRGHFLPDYVITSTHAVAAFEPEWSFRSHPFEGGSDHLPFLERGVPAVLAWHFPDAAYHTSLDRPDRVSGAEMRRVASVAGAVAVGLASGSDEDRAEMLVAVEHGAHVRLAQVLAAGREEIAGGGRVDVERRVARAWATWYDEALASLAHGDEDPLAAPVAEARARLAAEGELLAAALE